MPVTRRRSVLAVALPLAAVAALSVAQPAAALPIGTGGGGGGSIPTNQAPIPRFTISPNPALVSTQLQVQEAHAARIVDTGAITQLGGGDAVKFDASTSTDDHGIVKYEWDFDGNATYDATGKSVAHHYYATGTYDVRLRVTDADGVARTLVHAVKIHARPKARLAPNAVVALVGQSVTVTAKDSTDDNGIAKFDYDLDGDGTYETANGQNPQASTSFTTLGAHRIGVRVTDVYGATATASVPVTVHRAPTAAFTATPSPAVTGRAVTFDGSSSTDDDPIATYEWDLDGNGTYETSATTPTTTHTYTTPGTVTTRLRVTDDHGVQDVIARTLRIDAAPTTTTTTTTTKDTTAPTVVITPTSAKMSKKGVVTLKVACPKGEVSCRGRLTLKTLGRKGHKVGSHTFKAAGGRTATVKVTLPKAARKAVRAHGSLAVAASAMATDAAGNTRTTKVAVKITK